MPAYEALQNAIIDGNADIALALTNAALAEGAGAREILDTGLLPGMDEVGRRMKAGDCFIPEVLLSARTMQSCLDVLKPHLAAGESSSLGVIVIGTVEGDVHDIGKNLVSACCSKVPDSKCTTSAPGSRPPTSSRPRRSTTLTSSA